MKKFIVEITDEQFEKLWQEAGKWFIRENPRRPWTEREKREAVKIALQTKLTRVLQ